MSPYRRRSPRSLLHANKITHMDTSPVSPLLPLYLAQSVFGILYAMFIHWISVKEYLTGSTAYQVVFGDAGVMFILWLFFRESWSPAVVFACFVFAGSPMVITYLFRHEVQTHKRKLITGAAARIRDEAVGTLEKIMAEIPDEQITAVSLMYQLHKIIGALNAM